MRTPAAFVVLAILMFAPADLSTRAASAAVSCSAARGQMYIEQGRYDRAVREFTCLIEAAPTEVEGCETKTR